MTRFGLYFSCFLVYLSLTLSITAWKASSLPALKSDRAAIVHYDATVLIKGSNPAILRVPIGDPLADYLEEDEFRLVRRKGPVMGPRAVRLP